MSALEFFIFIVFFVVCIILYFYKNIFYWSKRNVLHDLPYPIVGSLNFFMRKSPTTWFIEKYQHFKRIDPSMEYYGVWIFRKPALVICSPDLARKVLVKDFDYFRDRFLSSGESDPLGGLNIFTANGTLWSTMRKQLTPVFTSSKLRALSTMINFYARELVDRIRSDHIVDNKEVDLRNIFTCYTTDVIGAASLGLTENSSRTNESVLRHMTRVISKFTYRRGVEFASVFFFPHLIDFFGFKFFTNEMSDYFKRVFWQVFEERERDPTSTKRDLLDALLEIRKQSQLEGKTEITDDVIISQAAIFIQGGFDTSGVYLSFFFFEMANNPEIQEKLHKEIKEANIYVNGESDYSIVKEMSYLNMCFKENLRKYPAMGFLDRIVTENYKLTDNLTLEKGTPVYVNAVGMQYDETYFPNPKKFDPERFSAENEAKIVPFSYIPFGEGPRSCIGMRFAQQSIKVLICQVLMNFKLSAKLGQPSVRDIEFDKRGVFLAPEQRLDVVFTERK